MNLESKIASIQAKIQRNARANVDVQETRELTENSVSKSNALARGYYRFGLNEKRVMEAMVSRLDPRKTNNDFQQIELRAVEYAKAFNVTTKNAYSELEGAVNGLVKKIITIPESADHYRQYPLMAEAYYCKSEGKIVATFNPLLTPHLQGLRKRFCSYPLKQASSFKSSYTWRFFELLVSWAKPKDETGGIFAGWLTIEVEELRKVLGVPSSYSWGMFNKKVLSLATKELQEKANIGLIITQQKTGRKITHLKIEFIESDES